MTDTLSSSVESSFGDAFVDVTIENNSLPNKNKNVKNKAIDCRRRLENRLEQRCLEKDLREFDFDLFAKER